MSEQNKALLRRWFEAWNARDLNAFDEIVAADAAQHDPQDVVPGSSGPEKTKQLVQHYAGGFSDNRFEVAELLADGDLVAARWTVTGTNDGSLMGMPPTGKAITLSGLTLARVVDGKLAESWVNWDTLGMLQQLGVIPAPQPA